MKEKMKRRHLGHLSTPANDYGKVDRLQQKSMRKENSFHLKNFSSSWFSFAAMVGIFSSILKFFFNNTSGFYGYDYDTKGPVAPEIIHNNNSRKRWYKTHVPKSMRKGLTHLETTQLRQKIYAGQVRYV